MTELSTDGVDALFTHCLAGEPGEGIVIMGIVNKATFSPAAITEHRDEIAALLNELPEGFQAASGGGWSFLNACFDRHGRQWTSFHKIMEELFMLGMAAGLVTELMPRKMWGTLPGGMPYYAIKATP